jgi:hypothetical protein
VPAGTVSLKSCVWVTVKPAAYSALLASSYVLPV